MSKVAIFDRSARPGAKKKDERRGRRRTGVGGGGGGRYEEGTKTNKGKFRNQFGEGYTVTGRRLAPEIVFDPKSRADFVTGFHKRKLQRQIDGGVLAKKHEREERKKTRQQEREEGAKLRKELEAQQEVAKQYVEEKYAAINQYVNTAPVEEGTGSDGEGGEAEVSLEPVQYDTADWDTVVTVKTTFGSDEESDESEGESDGEGEEGEEGSSEEVRDSAETVKARRKVRARRNLHPMVASGVFDSILSTNDEADQKFVRRRKGYTTMDERKLRRKVHEEVIGRKRERNRKKKKKKRRKRPKKK